MEMCTWEGGTGSLWVSYSKVSIFWHYSMSFPDLLKLREWATTGINCF
jgi:hypothetical protein